MRRVAPLLVLLAGCSWSVGPAPAPQPSPDPAPPPGEATCGTALARLEELGGCDVALDGFEKRCIDAQKAEAEIGIEYPVACMTAAGTCEAYRRCR